MPSKKKPAAARSRSRTPKAGTKKTAEPPGVPTLEQVIQQARRHKRFCVAAWWVDESTDPATLRHWTCWQDFPVADMPQALHQQRQAFLKQALEVSGQLKPESVRLKAG